MALQPLQGGTVLRWLELFTLLGLTLLVVGAGCLEPRRTHIDESPDRQSVQIFVSAAVAAAAAAVAAAAATAAAAADKAAISGAINSIVRSQDRRA